MSADQSDGKAATLQGDILPLRLIPDNWLLVNSLFVSTPHSDENAGPLHALRATLQMLKNLYYLNRDNNDSWKKKRDLLCLGLIKDTKKYGNTSVSMGAAKSVFERNSDSSKIAGFLNCGTGGIKYQLYDASELLRVVAELKPRDAASPQTLKIGNYVPKKELSFEECSRLLMRDLSSVDLPWAKDKSIPVYAFVTGTIRQHWEEANEAEKQLLENKMKDLFEPHNILPLSASYFMNQDDEGAFELKGAQAMYANLVAAKVLDEGLEVVGSFGIGRGSCQWMTAGKHGNAPELIGHKAGMANLNELAKVSAMLSNGYGKEAGRFELFMKNLEGVEKPVFALKSGAAMFLDNKENLCLKMKLKADVAYPTRTVRVAPLNDRNRLQSLTFTGSLDRLCAEGALKLQTTTEMETVYAEREGKLVVLKHVDDVKEKELLFLGPLVLCSPATSAAAATTTTAATTTATATTPTANATATAASVNTGRIRSPLPERNASEKIDSSINVKKNAGNYEAQIKKLSSGPSFKNVKGASPSPATRSSSSISPRLFDTAATKKLETSRSPTKEHS